MPMALVTRLCFPSTPNLSPDHPLLQTPLLSLKNSHNHSYHSIKNLSSCHPPNSFRSTGLSLLHTQDFRTKAITNFTTLKFATTSLEQALDTSPSNANASSDGEGTKADDEFSRTRLIAQNVPWTSTPEDIRALFERHGKVLEVELSMYNKTRNRGLAFVEMGSPEEALAALKNLESYEFEGRTLSLDFARPKKKKDPPPVQPKPAVTYNLFVANLSYEARAKDLREFFNSGSVSVVSAEVIFYDNPRKSAGYGFVSFESKEGAEAALSEFQGKIFMGRSIRVARGRQFVKQAVEESASSEEKSSELSSSGAQADKTV